MPIAFRKRLPGRMDLNEQYSAANIKQVLRDYRALPPGHHGDYKFGKLTAKFLHLGPKEEEMWENEAGTYPQDVQNEIKRHIIYALNHKDADGRDDPRPIKFKFSVGAPAVKATYHVTTQTYTIEIVGLPALMPSGLADRREKYKK
jgi:hypothetical protein